MVNINKELAKTEELLKETMQNAKETRKLADDLETVVLALAHLRDKYIKEQEDENT